MRTLNSQFKSSDCVHVLSVGVFGRAVTKYLKTFYPDLLETVWSECRPGNREEWPQASFVVVAAWRPVGSLCRVVDNLSYERGHPFVPVILDSPVLRLGPVTVPGVSGCWHCWDMRSRQHSPISRERSSLLEFYESNPNCGPAGYLESFAMIAAAQIGQVTRSSLTQIAGQIWQMNLFTREVSTGYLVGVDGCKRCGLNRPIEGRTYFEAKERLSHLWTEPIANGMS